jgi:hypothetical protein
MKTCETCRHYKPGKYFMTYCKLYKQYKETKMPCVDHRRQTNDQG